MDIDMPKGAQSIYHALRDAGIRDAEPLRNAPWITPADDGGRVAAGEGAAVMNSHWTASSAP